VSVLTGLSAFTLTPFDSDGIVDTDHLQQLVARLAATDIDSIGVLGSTGSYMYLDRQQRARAIKASVEASNGVPILAGVGDLRTNHVMQHVANAENAGASALLLAPVSYLPLTDGDFTALVSTVTSQTSLPVCLYNNPGTTHFSMSEELVASLAGLPTVQAVKNPAPATPLSADEIAEKRKLLPEKFALGYSGDAFVANVLPAGADAWYSVIAGTLPQLAIDIWSVRRETEKLQVLQSRCEPLWDCFKKYGGIRVVPEIARRVGLGVLNLPLPLQPLNNVAVSEVEAAVDALGIEKVLAA